MNTLWALNAPIRKTNEIFLSSQTGFGESNSVGAAQNIFYLSKTKPGLANSQHKIHNPTSNP